MKNYIIGIVGNKHSGKDTIAKMIKYIHFVGTTKATYVDYITCEKRSFYKYPDKIISFGDTLKKVVSILYNVSLSKLYDQECKDEKWFCLETRKLHNFIKDNIDNVFINIEDLENKSLVEVVEETSNKFHYIKLRTLLQYVGTEICRKQLDPDIWVKCTMNNAVDISLVSGICIIPDIRFANEANAVIHVKDSNIEKYVIKITRDTGIKDNHASESNIDKIDCDYHIENNGSLMNLFYKVLQVVTDIFNK